MLARATSGPAPRPRSPARWPGPPPAGTPSRTGSPQRPLQVADDLQPADHVGVHVRGEHLDPAPAELLGPAIATSALRSRSPGHVRRRRTPRRRSRSARCPGRPPGTARPTTARTSRSARSTRSRLGARPPLSSSTANSSPPQRASVSSARTAARSRRAAWASR